MVMLRISESTCGHVYEREHIFTWTNVISLLKKK